MLVYICGPMSGKPNLNQESFILAQEYLLSLGKPSVRPHDIPAKEHPGTECPESYAAAQEGHSAACFLRSDIAYMLMECDELFVLPGWETSVGARLEINVAAACGLSIVFKEN